MTRNRHPLDVEADYLRQQEEAHRCTDCDRRIGTNRGQCWQCRAKTAPHGLCRACGQPLTVGEKVAGVCAQCLPEVLESCRRTRSCTCWALRGERCEVCKERDRRAVLAQLDPEPAPVEDAQGECIGCGQRWPLDWCGRCPPCARAKYGRGS